MTEIVSTNPSRGNTPLGTKESTSQEDIKYIVREAHRAQSLWKHTTISERVKHVREIYDGLEHARETIAKSIAWEMGMPIVQAREDVSYALSYLSWYLDHAETYLSPEVTRETAWELHTVYYEPKGVIAAIAPWNYPTLMLVWTGMQPLLAGNAIVFKISKEVILTGKLFADIIEKTSLPDGVWTEVYGGGDVGEMLAQAHIDGITFTGSTTVWKHLRTIAEGKGIPSLLELGWSAPGIVLWDADIASILDTLYYMRFSNAWQMCDGLKRLIVEKSRKEELTDALSRLLAWKKIGDALDETTDIGPLVSEAQYHTLREQYDDALAKGATVLYQWDMPNDLDGNYFPPTLLGNISRDMRVWKEEVFGPLLPVIDFDTLEEAITLGNDTPYWLGAYVFTENTEHFHRIARSLKTGMVQMNTLNYGIPENPFWWYKNSGIGREHGRWGFHEFTDIKVVSLPKKV